MHAQGKLSLYPTQENGTNLSIFSLDNKVVINVEHKLIFLLHSPLPYKSFPVSFPGLEVLHYLSVFRTFLFLVDVQETNKKKIADREETFKMTS